MQQGLEMAKKERSKERKYSIDDSNDTHMRL